MNFIKSCLLLLVLYCMNFVYAQAVVVTKITDPNYIKMSMQSMQTNLQMLKQLATSVQNIEYNYKMLSANKNIASDFTAFASIFSTISNFMQDYVCQDCSPGAWSQQQYDAFEQSFCQNIAHILGTGGDVFNNIGDLAQDINQIMNLKFETMNPAQIATTQAQLLGSLGTGVQQTNTILNANLQMQTQALAKNQMDNQAANMQVQSSFKNMPQQVRP